MKILDKKSLLFVSTALLATGCVQTVDGPEDETWQLEPEVILIEDSEPTPYENNDKEPVVSPDPGVEPTPGKEPEVIEPKPVEPTPVEPTPTPGAVPALASQDCDFQPLWWQSESVSRITPSVFDISPDESLLVRGEGDFGEGWGATRLSTGDVITTYSPTPYLGISSDFKRTLTRTYEQDEQEYKIRVTDVERDVSLIEISGSDWSGRAVLDADGDRVATYTCEYIEDIQRTFANVALWDVTSGEQIARHSVPQDGCFWYGSSLDLQISDDGNHVAFITNFERTFSDEDPFAKLHLMSVGYDREVFHTMVVPLVDGERDETSRYRGQVSALRFTPDSERISVTSGGGLRTELSTETFEVLSQEKRGAFVSNPDTYLPPMPMSPTEWTRDGEVMASVALDGSVELRDSDGEVFQTIVAPEESDIAQWNPDIDVPNAPVGITFSPDGESVAVSFRKGVGLWGCRDAVEPQTTGLRSVSLEVPDVEFAGKEVPLDITLEGQGRGQWTIYKLYVDGYLRASGTRAEDLKWKVNTDGVFNVEVEVDDGWGSVRSEVKTIRFVTPR
jgi:WD40 repeat protein